jgi:hypothetical protein
MRKRSVFHLEDYSSRQIPSNESLLLLQDESLREIDPSAILPGARRTRGVKVDYTSAEALAKAQLKPEDIEDESDDDVHMKED